MHSVFRLIWWPAVLGATKFLSKDLVARYLARVVKAGADNQDLYDSGKRPLMVPHCTCAIFWVQLGSEDQGCRGGNGEGSPSSPQSHRRQRQGVCVKHFLRVCQEVADLKAELERAKEKKAQAEGFYHEVKRQERGDVQ